VANTKQSLSVIEHLRNALICGQILPGEILSTASISQEFGIGLTPVREALIALEAEGIVEQEHGVGVRVVTPGVARVDQLFDIRAILEGQAAYWLATKASELALRLIEHEARRLDDTLTEERRLFVEDAGSDDFHRFRRQVYAAEYEFHSHFIEYCDSPDLTVAWRSAYTIWQLSDDRSGQLEMAPGVSYRGLGFHHHTSITDAITSGEPEHAREAAGQHATSVRTRLLEFLSSQNSDIGKPVSSSSAIA
jgi:DNA-binding GntR family transcriptional regulator